MPGMESFCVMHKEMEAMRRDMESIKDMEHCMPDMPVHCKEIAQMKYMEKRMGVM